MLVIYVILEVIEKGLAMRDKVQIGLKWPLASATINVDGGISEELQEIVMSQLNVKSLEIKKSKEISVGLDTNLTPGLEAEGYAREISRKVQAARKNAGLVKSDKIKLGLELPDELVKLVEVQLDFIKARTNSKELVVGEGQKGFKHVSEEKIKGKVIGVLFSKL